MKKIETTNAELLEKLNEVFEITCNEDMEMVINDSDEAKIMEYMENNFPAAICDINIY